MFIHCLYKRRNGTTVSHSSIPLYYYNACIRLLNIYFHTGSYMGSTQLHPTNAHIFYSKTNNSIEPTYQLHPYFPQ